MTAISFRDLANHTARLVNERVPAPSHAAACRRSARAWLRDAAHAESYGCTDAADQCRRLASNALRNAGG